MKILFLDNYNIPSQYELNMNKLRNIFEQEVTLVKKNCFGETVLFRDI